MTQLVESKQLINVELKLPVQPYDIDFAGVVSNIVYIRWLEDLRVALVSACFSLSEMVEQDIAPILLETSIQYKQPVVLFDLPIGRMWMSKMKYLRWTVSAEILVGEKLVATAEQIGCFINLSSRKPVSIPKELSQAFRLREP
ncbi:thioesterase family protein [Tumidithrix elongata RA019]|uniref:Thioesterase family protein n=1 Tax=Tumidithrix elongata BACA0141 TaxID=2716417 RepID=A0AAW9QA52_9CYAN|nr:thioesterase family protein [Tumidithrix elongata RA019]